jgi:hypothetical protein
MTETELRVRFIWTRSIGIRLEGKKTGSTLTLVNIISSGYLLFNVLIS